MSPEAPRPPVRSGRRSEAEPAISPEEVAAVLAAVKALVEEEVATEPPVPTKSDAWAAAGRPGPPASPRSRGPGRPGA